MARDVVILGGGGFIGSNLAIALHQAGEQVTAVDVHYPDFRAAALDDIDQLTLDLTDPRAVTNVMEGADVVFHLAADMGGVGYFHSDADLGASLTNGRITNNVASAAARTGVRVFYAASACAYPIEWMSIAVLTEDMLGHGTPDALYGAEKLHGLRLFSKVPNARVGVFDTIYGPLQEHEGRRMKFPAAVATKAIAARRTGRLELWGDGTQTRAYLYVDDAIERIIRIALDDRYAGPVNVGSTTSVSCKEVARMCLDIAGVPDAEIVTNPAEPSGVPARVCSSAKYEATYGATAVTSLRNGFGRFIGWLDGQRPTTATRTPQRNAMAPKPTVR